MSDADALRSAETWFLEHGLPYFVDDVRADIRRRLSRPRLVLVMAVALLAGLAAGLGVGILSDSGSFGFAVGAWVVAGVAAAYALFALRMHDIAGWALKRAFASLGLLFPLATRALPMLLIFVTFLFINTEVWQVTSAMKGGVIWGAVLFFGLAAAGFLVVRLDEELDQFDDDISVETFLDVTADTPLAPTARRLVDEGTDLQAEAEVTGLQKANLVLVLLVAQAVQVLLLAVRRLLLLRALRGRRDRGLGHHELARRGPPHLPVGPPGEPGAGAGLDLPGGVQRPLLHGLRRHRQQLPPAVLRQDHARARPRRRRPDLLPRAATYG